MLLKYELKQNMRYRFRTVILILLLTIVSFFLIMQVSIYYKGVTEINRAKNTYLTVASIEKSKISESGAIDAISFDILNQISKNPYVLYIDNRRNLAGVNYDLKHVDDKKLPQKSIYIKGDVLSITDTVENQDVALKVDSLISGELPSPSGTIHAVTSAESLSYIKKFAEETGKALPDLEVGKSYYFRLQPGYINQFSIVSYALDNDSSFLYGAYSDAGLFSSSHLIFTSSVESIQAFHSGAAIITEGRSFSKEDYQKGNVCLISETFANENSLSIGDRISFHMIYGGLYIVGDALYSSILNIAEQQQSVTPDVSDSPKKDFFIVGIYKNRMENEPDLYGKYYFGPNTVFIPIAGYPESVWDNLNEIYKNEIHSSLISIVIKTGYEADFLNSLTESGFPINDYNITIDDGGYNKLAGVLNSMKENAFQFIILLLISIVAVLVLFVYLYLDKSRQSYIIMRMLGVEKRRVSRSVLSGLLIIGITGIILGALAGAFTATQLVSQAYEQTKETVLGTAYSYIYTGQKDLYNFSPEVPMQLILLTAGSIFVMLIIFTITGLKGGKGKKNVKLFLS